jgi:predicted aminopeptidase
VPAFEAVLAGQDGDLRRFYAEVARLGRESDALQRRQFCQAASAAGTPPER